MLRRTCLGLCLAVLIASGFGCATVPTRVDIYIGTTAEGVGCDPVDIEQDGLADHVLVLPGDLLVLTNMQTKPVKVTIPRALIVEGGTGDHVEVYDPYTRHAYEVYESAPGTLYSIEFTCDGGGTSGPKIVVGNPP